MEMMRPNEVLRRRGFTQEEIERLYALRQTLWEQRKRQAMVTQRRLEFVRWMVAKGRITEHTR